MEITLSIVAIIGGLLFIFSYLKFVLSGFRYHPITGLLAFIPVVNLITLPTLMDDKLIRTIILGVLGLILAVGSWFLGADKSLQKHISTLRGEPTIVSSSKQELIESSDKVKPETASTKKINTAETNTATAEITPTDDAAKETQKKEAPQPVYFATLPRQALYSMAFIETSPQKIDSLKGRIVRITSTNDTVIEGQIQNIEKGSVFISKNGEGNIAYEMLIANIKQLLVMVKRKK